MAARREMGAGLPAAPALSPLSRRAGLAFKPVRIANGFEWRALGKWHMP
jgi:hypothetical protein